jgi:hypothetical protein
MIKARYLELHHGSWRVVVGYREGGKVIKLRRSLGTDSLREADALKWPVVAEIKAEIKAAKAAERNRPWTFADL